MSNPTTTTTTKLPKYMQFLCNTVSMETELRDSTLLIPEVFFHER
jgi:hypothetical protein